MPKELKPAAELKEIVDHRLRIASARLDGSQWIRIIPLDPPVDGVNWMVAHGGMPTGLSEEIDRIMPVLQKL